MTNTMSFLELLNTHVIWIFFLSDKVTYIKRNKTPLGDTYLD